jgi:predicted negative regulator of RcsB-dependent stress response
MKTALGVVIGVLLVMGLLFAFGIFEEADDGPIENAVENVENAVEDVEEGIEEGVEKAAD